MIERSVGRPRITEPERSALEESAFAGPAGVLFPLGIHERRQLDPLTIGLDLPGLQVLLGSFYRLADGRCLPQPDVEHHLPEAGSLHQDQRIYTPSEMRLLFELAGLRDIRVAGCEPGEFRMRELDPDAVEMMLVGDTA